MGDMNMDKLKWFAFAFFILMELGILYYVSSYTFQKGAIADRYSILIDAGEKCINQVKQNPQSQIFPLCEISLKTILLKGNQTNNILIKTTFGGIINGTT
jgi:hypothetical protein